MTLFQTMKEWAPRLFDLNRDRSWESRWVSLKLNWNRARMPFFVALGVTLVWLFFRVLAWHPAEGAQGMLETAILLLAAIFAVPAGLILNQAWEHMQALSRCILTADEREFMIKRDEKLPFAIYSLLGVPGFAMLILISIAEYPTLAIGAIIVFSSWFTMIFYFVVIRDLQDPIASMVWFLERTPPEWRAPKVDDYFGLKVVEAENYSRRPAQSGSGVGGTNR